MSKGKHVVQAAHYLFWSLMTTAVSWGTYTLCELLQGEVLSAKWTTLIAGVISWIVAVSFSFTVNKWLVFKSQERTARCVIRELITFFSTRLAVGLLEIVLVPLLVWIGWDVPLFGVDGLLLKCLMTPLMIALNYVCGRFLVFRTEGTT
jgi:putative flippase GtrA